MTYRLLYTLIVAIASIPFGMLYAVSDCLAALLYHLVRYRRKVVRRNLLESFPDKSTKEIRKIERGFYRYFTDNILESCKMATISPEEMKRRMAFPNVEEVNSLLRSGRSIALFLGHYGNWEWVSTMPLHLEKSAVAAQIYHKLRNDNIDRLMLKLRTRMGAICVDMHKTARWITTEAAKGHTCIVGFIADQSPKRKEIQYYLDFLHHRTPVLVGTEKLAKHFGYDAWFVRVDRVKRGYYEARFVKMAADADSLPDYKLTDIYFSMLQNEINEHPELYLWTHNRFKYATKIIL